MENNIHFLSYLAQFFLEWEMLQTKFAEQIKARIYFSNVFSTIMPFMRESVKIT